MTSGDEASKWMNFCITRWHSIYYRCQTSSRSTCLQENGAFCAQTMFVRNLLHTYTYTPLESTRRSCRRCHALAARRRYCLQEYSSPSFLIPRRWTPLLRQSSHNYASRLCQWPEEAIHACIHTDRHAYKHIHMPAVNKRTPKQVLAHMQKQEWVVDGVILIHIWS